MVAAISLALGALTVAILDAKSGPRVLPPTVQALVNGYDGAVALQH